MTDGLALFTPSIPGVSTKRAVVTKSRFFPIYERCSWIAIVPSSTVPDPKERVHGMVQVTKPLGFIEKHGIGTNEQRRQAEEIKRRCEKDNLQLVRVAWADPHGASRAKALTIPA